MIYLARNNSRWSLRLLLAAGVMAAGAIIFSDGASAQSIASSKHNLGSGGSAAGNSNFTSATGEICVFCHTPHGSSTTAAAPIWNKSLPSAPTYTMYTSTTFDGESTASLANSVSLACLSCHDGSQAMDTVLNAPGSGWGSGRIGTDADWTGNATLQSGAVTMLNDSAGLSNDHPVGMRYAKTSDGTTLDADFVASVNDGTLEYVDTTTARGGGSQGARDKTDMILYDRGDNIPRVECATCHDPHVETNGTFLRISNTGSNVCLTCHTK